MDRQLEIEAGFPVAAPVTGEGQVLAAVLPAGRYATLWHTGHPDELAGATRTLLDWATRQGLAWDVTSTPDGERWGCRPETYHDEPGQDMSEWETELAFNSPTSAAPGDLAQRGTAPVTGSVCLRAAPVRQVAARGISGSGLVS